MNFKQVLTVVVFVLGHRTLKTPIDIPCLDFVENKD